MSQLITASIDVMKIDKARLITGKKGTYLNVTIWVNDQPDQFGNNVSIEQKTDKGQTKIYLGNGKTYHKKDVQKPENNEGVSQKGKITTGSKSDINDLPGVNNESSDLPFN
jgi:hypothetical protein